MHLPKHVRIKHGRYYYDAGRDDDGKRRWLPLSRVTDGEHALYKELSRVTRPQARTLNDLFDSFIGSPVFAELGSASQKGYIGYIDRSLRPVFGEMPPDDLRPSDIAQFLEMRQDQGAAVSGNREIACLSSVYNYGMRKGWVEANPCRGVRRNREKPKDRYVRHDEFLVVFEACPEELQDFLAVLYLTGLRPGETRALLKSHITPEGLRIEESKTGKVRLIEWSESLRFFILRANSRSRGPYLLTNSRGERWTEWAIYSALRRVREALRREGVDAPHWSPHALRAKAESDSKEGLGLLPIYKRMRRTKPVW